MDMQLNTPEQRQVATQKLLQLKHQQQQLLNQGLPPQDFSQAQAWLHAIDAGLAILREPKLQDLQPNLTVQQII